MFNTLLKYLTNTRVLITVLVAVFTAFFAHGWVLSPQLEYLNAAQQYEQLSQKTEIKSKFVKTKNLNNTKLMKELSGYLENTKSVFYTAETAEKFISSIKQMANESGCVMVSHLSRPEQAVETELENHSVTSCSQVVKLTSSFPALVNFLEKLSAGHQAVLIDSMNVSLDRQTGAFINCDMTITIYIAHPKE